MVDSAKGNGYELVNMEGGGNPIIMAAKAGDLKALRLNLEKGDIFEAKDGQQTALHYAANLNDMKSGTECATAILEKVVKSNSSQLRSYVNLEGSNSATALMLAASKGNDTLIELLLEKGAMMGKTRKGETVFFYLATLKGGDQGRAVKCAGPLLNLANFESDQGRQDYLNSGRTDTLRTALHMSAIHANHKLMELLIRNGADALRTDIHGSTVFHYAVDNAYEEKATLCTMTLMQPSLTEEWTETKLELLLSLDKYGRAPIHLAARRGFYEIVRLLLNSCALTETKTGYTALHLAASLGDPDEAAKSVESLLQSLPESIQRTKGPESGSNVAEYLYSGSMEKKDFINAQDLDGCTALYLAAKHRNVDAAKELLLAGSALDIKSKRGKTALQKVYENIPLATKVLLDQALKTSGYVAKPRANKVYMDLDYEPILGLSTSNKNVYKEAQDLEKVLHASFDERKEILDHPFVRVFIHKKWERIQLYFKLFRAFHILWFFLNFIFLVSVYRVLCPADVTGKTFSWTGLRPTGDHDENSTHSLAECDMDPGVQGFGILNLIILFFYLLCRLLQFQQRFHWLCRPVKPFRGEKENPIWLDRLCRSIVHYFTLLLEIIPVWPLVLGAGILITTLPTIGLQPFSEFSHYIIAGVMGFFLWVCIYLEFGKIPEFRVYIILLKKATQTLLWAISVTAPLLCGFATVFVILKSGDASFSSALQSFVKVITFMIGELDYNGFFYGDEKESLFTGFLMLSLAIFVVFIVLLLVNFLIGLTAEDIRDFRERKEVWKRCVQLEQIATLERFLDESVPWFGRNFLRQKLMLMRPVREDDIVIKQKRRALIYLPSLPREMQKELHKLKLPTIREEH